MFRYLLSTALLALALTNQTEAAVLGQFSTDTTAVAGGLADVNSDFGPESSVPLATSSIVFDATDFASSSGIAALGVLNSYAEVSSVNSFSSGVGSVTYSALVSGANRVLLHFDLTSSIGSASGGYSSTSLNVQISSLGSTVFSQVLTTDGMFDYSVPLNGTNNVTFQLVSEASTLSGGSAFSSGLLTYTITAVPETGSFLLMAGGLGVLLLRGSKGGKRRERSLASFRMQLRTLRCLRH